MIFFSKDNIVQLYIGNRFFFQVESLKKVYKENDWDVVSFYTFDGSRIPNLPLFGQLSKRKWIFWPKISENAIFYLYLQQEFVFAKKFVVNFHRKNSEIWFEKICRKGKKMEKITLNFYRRFRTLTSSRTGWSSPRKIVGCHWMRRNGNRLVPSGNARRILHSAPKWPGGAGSSQGRKNEWPPDFEPRPRAG